jgi:hypothetical protein
MNELIENPKKAILKRTYTSHPAVKKGWLNLREQTVIDAWLETGSYAECIRRVKEVTGTGMDIRTIQRWLGGNWNIKNYVKEKMQELGYSGMTKDEYLVKLRRIAEGKEEGNLRAWELFGKVKGWYEAENVVVNQFSAGIHFVQRDGSE